MSHWRRVIAVAGALLCLAAPGGARAQKRPFPQGGGYPHGFLASGLTATDAQTVYQRWKTTYLKTDCGSGYCRVEFNSPTGSTVSEGMGYGMVLTAYFGDRTEFDGLWKFVKKNLNSDGLMGWKVTCAGFDTGAGGSGSATDGDLDVAFGLVAAVDQWGDDYRQPALDLLAAIKDHDFGTCPTSGRVMASAGNWDTSACPAHSNTSYWMPGYYRVFAALTGDSFWTKAADDAVALWAANQALHSSGLIANEVGETGAAGSGQDQVDYNGCRIPWRAVLDYVWNGTAGAKTVVDTMTDWVDAQGIANTVDGYKTDGTPTGGWKNGSDCWIGGWTTGAMAHSQDRLDRFASDFKSLTIDNYYETSLRALYMLLLTGNMWQPGTGGGETDGGAPADDGGSPPASDGGASDGGASDGGASDGGADGGGGGGGGGGGCGCAASGGPSAFGVLLLVVVVIRARRRPR